MAHLANLVMTPEIQIRKNSHCNCKQPILDRTDLSVFSGSDVYSTCFNWMSRCSEKKKERKPNMCCYFVVLPVNLQQCILQRLLTQLKVVITVIFNTVFWLFMCYIVKERYNAFITSRHILRGINYTFTHVLTFIKGIIYV